MSSVFDRPVTGSSISPQTDLLRDMMFRKIAAMQADPYGGSPSFSSAGRGVMDPTTGGYSPQGQPPGGGWGSPGGGRGFPKSPSAETGPASTPSSSGPGGAPPGGSFTPEMFRKLLQYLMARRGEPGSSEGGWPAMKGGDAEPAYDGQRPWTWPGYYGPQEPAYDGTVSNNRGTPPPGSPYQNPAMPPQMPWGDPELEGVMAGGIQGVNQLLGGDYSTMDLGPRLNLPGFNFTGGQHEFGGNPWMANAAKAAGWTPQMMARWLAQNQQDRNTQRTETLAKSPGWTAEKFGHTAELPTAANNWGRGSAAPAGGPAWHSAGTNTATTTPHFTDPNNPFGAGAPETAPRGTVTPPTVTEGQNNTTTVTRQPNTMQAPLMTDAEPAYAADQGWGGNPMDNPYYNFFGGNGYRLGGGNGGSRPGGGGMQGGGPDGMSFEPWQGGAGGSVAPPTITEGNNDTTPGATGGNMPGTINGSFPWLQGWGGAYAPPMNSTQMNSMNRMSQFSEQPGGGNYDWQNFQYDPTNFEQIQSSGQTLKDMEDSKMMRELQSRAAAGGNAMSGALLNQEADYGRGSNAAFQNLMGQLRMGDVQNQRGLWNQMQEALMGNQVQNRGMNMSSILNAFNMGNRAQDTSQRDLTGQLDEFHRQQDEMKDQWRYPDTLAMQGSVGWKDPNQNTYGNSQISQWTALLQQLLGGDGNSGNIDWGSILSGLGEGVGNATNSTGTTGDTTTPADAEPAYAAEPAKGPKNYWDVDYYQKALDDAHAKEAAQGKATTAGKVSAILPLLMQVLKGYNKAKGKGKGTSPGMGGGKGAKPEGSTNLIDEIKKLFEGDPSGDMGMGQQGPDNPFNAGGAEDNSSGQNLGYGIGDLSWDQLMGQDPNRDLSENVGGGDIISDYTNFGDSGSIYGQDMGDQGFSLGDLGGTELGGGGGWTGGDTTYF